MLLLKGDGGKRAGCPPAVLIGRSSNPKRRRSKVLLPLLLPKGRLFAEAVVQLLCRVFHLTLKVLVRSS